MSNYKLYFFILLVFFSLNRIFSQEQYLVVDSVYKTPISFATIKSVNQNEGIVCDEFGKFVINDKIKDTVEIRCLGYQTKKITLNQIKDSIFLKPISFELEEVYLSKKSFQLKEIGLKRKKIGWHMNSNLQIGTFIKPSKLFVNSRILKINIPIDTKTSNPYKDTVKFTDNYRSLLKIHFFSVQNNYPDKSLLEKPISIYIHEKDTKYIVIDLMENSINFSEEGVFICVEMVGELDENGNVKKLPFHRPTLVFTEKNTDEFQSETYLKSKFDDQWIKIDHQKIQLEKDLFIALSLIVQIDEK